MNKTYLEDLLKSLDNVQYGNYDAVKAIQAKTVEAMKVLFPMEIVQAGEVSRIKFDHWSGDQGNMALAWTNGKRNLASLLAAKIDVLEHKEAAERQSFSQRRRARAIIAAEKALSESAVNVPELQSKVTELETSIQKISSENLLLKTLNEESKVVINGLKKEVKKRQIIGLLTNGVFLTIIPVVIGGVFVLGHYFGSNKFDNDKMDMRDTITSLRQQVKSLENKRRQDSTLKISKKTPDK